MKATVPAGRARAVKLLGKYLSTPHGRRQVAPGGFGRSIVPAEWDETIGDVMDRAGRTRPPVTIAILRNDDLLFLGVEPGEPGTLGSEKASPQSSIGMLYEALDQSGRNRLTFQITEWSAVTAIPIPI